MNKLFFVTILHFALRLVCTLLHFLLHSHISLSFLQSSPMYCHRSRNSISLNLSNECVCAGLGFLWPTAQLKA